MHNILKTLFTSIKYLFWCVHKFLNRYPHILIAFYAYDSFSMLFLLHTSIGILSVVKFRMNDLIVSGNVNTSELFSVIDRDKKAL